MKKLFLLLFASYLLSGCACMLSQIPPQYVVSGPGCTASIPDYKPSVQVTGGCTGFTLYQTPAPGTLLTATNKTATIVLKAIGTNNKSSQVSFTVTMIDTITPKITPVGALVEYKVKQVNEVYDIADAMLHQLNTEFDRNFPWSAQGLTPVIDSSYYKKMLIVVSLDSLNYRKRFITFADSINTY
jgi:hypothetical protein